MNEKRMIAQTASRQQRPLLMAHYMPWFEAKPKQSQWGWHWTMNAFNPEQITTGKRQIASQYYPLIGPYDSGDATVIEYHFLLMKLAGIDGVIVDWYGLSNFLDYPALHRNTGALVQNAARFKLQIGICYEDQTIPKLVEAKRIMAEQRISFAAGELQWLRQNWFRLPSYLQINKKPVLLSFGTTGLSDEEWQQVLRTVDTPLLYFSEHRRRNAAVGAFDWPQPQRGLASVDAFYQSAKGETLFIPSAFPRFHDIYKEAKVGDSYGRIEDERGRTFDTTLTRAWNSGAPIVQIATWNDWGEGTMIEPSAEFGYRDLETTQRLRRMRDGQFRTTADDLRLPYRLWALRQRQAGQPMLLPRLNTVAGLLTSGKMPQARLALQRIEAEQK